MSMLKVLLLAACLRSVALARTSPVLRRTQFPCQNSPTNRNCWGAYSIDTNYYEVFPNTSVTREYWLSVQNITLAPDGYRRQVLVFNGTYPGPVIEADWGDNLIIHVTNELTNNGTAVHWHGVRQLFSNEYDGVPGVTQCAIAPGDSMTYKFRATQYGTSWYHSHWSLQLADGLYGPIVINGPATANYDVDLGPVFITDWFHEPSPQVWDLTAKYGGQPIKPNPIAENGLFNGTNMFSCNGIDDNCLGTGRRSETFVTQGTKYRLRIIGAQTDGWMKFSIDGHNLTVIAADFVPIVPYVTNNVILAAGQRYDVVFETTQDVGNYWMRATYQTACNGNTNGNEDGILGILRYDGANTTALPTTSPWSDITNSCGDEPLSDLTPYFLLDVDMAAEQEELALGFFYETDLVFHWTLNTKHLQVDWGAPTDLTISQGKSVFPTDSNIYSVDLKNKWTYWVIQDVSLVDAYHPFHLHGHDFAILAQGSGLFTASTPLKRKNPPRRDTATMIGNGYVVIAFKTDNPGSWLFHCHIAWHASQSLALQIVERESEIGALLLDKSLAFNNTCIKWNNYYATSLYKQDDSGF